MIHLDLLSHRETGSAAISTRRRWPASFPDESLAVAQAVALLKQHSELCGFILVPDGLQAANDAYLHERTITVAENLPNDLAQPVCHVYGAPVFHQAQRIHNHGRGDRGQWQTPQRRKYMQLQPTDPLPRVAFAPCVLLFGVKLTRYRF